MSRSSYPLKLPLSIKQAAQRLAKEDGVSLNQWISVAVAQKIGAVETAADYLRQRAGDARPSDMLVFLDKAQQEAPPAGDEPASIPFKYKRASAGRAKKPVRAKTVPAR